MFLMKPTQAKLKYFDIMRGPWDRQDHQKPFAVDFEKPVGAGFYPEDLDEEKLKKYVDENPEDAAALNNLVTMVDREDGGNLVATNYSQVSFSGWWWDVEAQIMPTYNWHMTCLELRNSDLPSSPGASASADEPSCGVDRQWESSQVSFKRDLKQAEILAASNQA